MAHGDDPLFQQRLAKAERLRARGVDPYPLRATRTHTTAEAIGAFTAAEARGEEFSETVFACGRIHLKRESGKKVRWLDLVDGAGKLQVYCREDELGERGFALLDDLDLGDFVQAGG